jgi:hypothetical protein
MAQEISEQGHAVCGDDATEWSEENNTRFGGMVYRKRVDQ